MHWRDVLPIDAAAELLPLLPHDELLALGEDIKKHGLTSPIVLGHWDKYDRIFKLWDGRNRLDALEAVGLLEVHPVKKEGADSVEWPTILIKTSTGPQPVRIKVLRECDGYDPYAYVLSANIHRRHLTNEQKRELIAKLLKARPEQSNRQIAKLAKVDDKTVASVRREKEAGAEIPHLEKRVGGDGKTYAQPTMLDAESTSPAANAPTVMLKTHRGEEVPYKLRSGKATFNKTNEQVSWAAWTWNPVTGCLHNCQYCYARELALKASYREAYPIGFEPLFHPERLDAPKNTRVPEEARSDSRLKRVFVCSMADLYGKWVPDEWITQVHASCIANPQWDYLLLTKFPRRYVVLDLPPTAWLGTSVDEQKRVRFAEEAFGQIKGVRVKWLSLEPLLAPLEFKDLSMFDWIVIGAQSATNQPDGHVKEFAPPFEWVARLYAQAKECGCRVYLKPNLLGEPRPHSPGMQLLQEEPVIETTPAAADLSIPQFLRR
jgi:protein gp37